MKNAFSKLICPICGNKLLVVANSYVCKQNQCFDIAKQGYCNLLPVNKKHSLLPGDNKLMIDARYNFLEKGYYQPLSDHINKIFDKLFDKPITILDAGCGYGYYSNNLYYHRGAKDNIQAVDISKFAVAKGAKFKHIDFYVSSVFDLPFEDKSFDAIVNVFSPYANKEFGRVAKDNGYLIIVYPATNHLIELKEFLYQDNTVQNNKEVNFDNWTSLFIDRLTFQFELGSCSEVNNLFYMTPYCYTTDKESIEKLSNFDKKLITADFYIKVFKM